MKIFFALILSGLISICNAQVSLGTIKGVLYEANNSTAVIPFAKITVQIESGKRYAVTDETGHYKIDALKPGVYSLVTDPLNFAEVRITDIAVKSNKIATVNVYCKDDNQLPEIIVHVPLIIEKEIPRIEISVDDIKNSPYIRDPKGLLAATTSEIQQVEGTGDLIIRGSRPGDAVYYLDGVKANDLASIPGISIGSIQAYTGGVPAKYGDTTGGIIVLETKSYFDLYRAWKYQH